MGLVCFAFGVTQLPLGQSLAGPVLIELLGQLGVAEPAARSLLLRMRKEGMLESERAGREALYRLAPAVTAAMTRIDGQLRGERPAWGGSFSCVLYEVPERSRDYRDRLRRTAQLLGYAILRPGLLVATADRWAELAAMLPPQPSGSQLLPATLTLSAADSQRAAAKCWNLDSLAARYRHVLAQTQARLDEAERHPPSAGAAFGAFAAATLPVYETAADDPDLPAELLPADWPGQQLTSTLDRAFRVFLPVLGDYLTGLQTRAGRAHPATTQVPTG
jgi:phenylacetic acid degradation operon negative regulatory protein